MANAKIIGIVDHEIAAALRLTAGDIGRLRQEDYDRQAIARDQTQRDIAFVADNLRHDLKTLSRDVGRDSDALVAVNNKLRSDAHALAVVQDQLRQDINTLAAAVNQLRQELDQLKQGGVSPEPND